MKLSHILIAMIIFSFAACAEAQEGWYIELGLSVHSEKLDYPEFQGSNPLVNIGIGYSISIEDGYIDIYGRHTSSTTDYEKGYGLNQIGIQVRKYL